jgi:hypothetical protein
MPKLLEVGARRNAIGAGLKSVKWLLIHSKHMCYMVWSVLGCWFIHESDVVTVASSSFKIGIFLLWNMGVKFGQCRSVLWGVQIWLLLLHMLCSVSQNTNWIKCNASQDMTVSLCFDPSQFYLEILVLGLLCMVVECSEKFWFHLSSIWHLKSYLTRSMWLLGSGATHGIVVPGIND